MRTLLRRSVYLIGILLVSVLAFFIWASLPVSPFQPPDYDPVAPRVWPTVGWQRSSPEEQGMNSSVLLEMQSFYEASAAKDPTLYIDSLTIIRNGTLVAEVYNNPLYPRDEMHVVHSATKSIVSALVGIAIEQGHIDSVDASVLDIFSDYDFQNVDARKRALTIRDLLSMESGLHSRDSHLYAYEGLFDLQKSEDWIQFALDVPMAAKPGERFDYSNTATFLLSAIVMKTTGMDTLEFARQNLFAPLGIKDVKWEWNAQGLPIAWARMWLKPNDMAKIGLLYLQKGQWEGEQIIPADWVRDSLTPSAYPKNGVDILHADMSKNQETTMRNWVAQKFIRPFTDGYGYQWWLDRDGAYTALGTNGQYIMVAPEQNLIFVVTAKCGGLAQFMPVTLFRDYVLRAIESDAALPVNEAAQAKLSALATPPKMSHDRVAVPALPPVAMEISGVTYALEENPFKTNKIRFLFDPKKDTADIRYTARENWDVDYTIGLDKVPRFTETNDSTFVAVGEWTSPNTFSLKVEIVGYSSFDRWTFRFQDDKITVTEHSLAGDFTYNGAAE